MNFQQLINMAQQMKKMKSPQKLTQEQQKIVNEFKSKSKEEQAQIVANKCNELGISKGQLEQLIYMFK